MAEEYLRLHPRGSAIVTQFQSRPEIIFRVEKNHRPTVMSYAEAIFSPVMPHPSAESIRYRFIVQAPGVNTLAYLSRTSAIV